jgi:hypothetical protein
MSKPAVLALLALLVLTGCQADEPQQRPRPLAPVAPEPAPAYDATAEPAAAVLALVPQTADTVTVTDWDAIRVQLGQPDLTSDDLVTDRIAFWERVDTEAAALTDGMLRGEASTLELDHGFTQDDVDWEAHWRGEDGHGFALALRPGLDLDGVREAIREGVGPLDGAELRAEDRLVVAGTSDTDVWANEEQWEPLVDEPATATYLQRGCTPLDEALGPDVDAEDRARLLEEHPLTTLDELPGFALAFGDHTAIVWVEPGRADLFERLRIGEDWPVPPFAATFTNGAADPSSGRLGYAVDDPPAAVALTLLRELPFALCPGG